MLVAVDDVVTKPKSANVECHSAAPLLFQRNQCCSSSTAQNLREFQQVRQPIDNLVRGILAKAKALLALGDYRQSGTLTCGNAIQRVFHTATAISRQSQTVYGMQIDVGLGFAALELLTRDQKLKVIANAAGTQHLLDIVERR